LFDLVVGDEAAFVLGHQQRVAELGRVPGLALADRGASGSESDTSRSGFTRLPASRWSVEASGGDVRRHRLNRSGNRQLNTALHLIAVCQIRDPSPGQVYYRRKLTQAKTPEEARRSLKRHLSNVVYSHVVTDRRHRTGGC
jgi:transposase